MMNILLVFMLVLTGWKWRAMRVSNTGLSTAVVKVANFIIYPRARSHS